MKSCDKQLTYEEKELELVRSSVDNLENLSKQKIARSPIIKKIINILEKFLRRKKLICYGGTALNNVLPVKDQFYNKDLEIPDYDFYSPNAINDAKELADIYFKAGYESVEARAGVHHGTYKVFVQFIPIADITQMEDTLFNSVRKESIKIDGILYAPINFLRLNIYKELSRPMGDISRWEKIYKRLNLLNKHYPMKNPKCDTVNFMRDFEGDPNVEKSLYNVVKEAIIDQGLVFFGGYASSIYSKYMPVKTHVQEQSIPDFDALSEEPEKSAIYIKDKLEKAGFSDIKIYKKPGIGEIIASHYEIVYDKDTICFIYEPLGCHSYNTITINKKPVKIATIDTMLNLCLAFIYADRPYYDHSRILCMAEYLFKVQSKNKLKQTGLLKRFSKECYGNETTIETIRENKTKKFKELKHNRRSKEYQEYFMKYDPSQKYSKKTKKSGKQRKTGKTRKNSLINKLNTILNL
jgi:hypothetical protein